MLAEQNMCCQIHVFCWMWLHCLPRCRILCHLLRAFCSHSFHVIKQSLNSMPRDAVSNACRFCSCRCTTACSKLCTTEDSQNRPQQQSRLGHTHTCSQQWSRQALYSCTGRQASSRTGALSETCCAQARGKLDNSVVYAGFIRRLHQLTCVMSASSGVVHTILPLCLSLATAALLGIFTSLSI